MILLFLLLCFVFLFKSNNLLLSLLILEIISFVSIYIFSCTLSSLIFSDFMIILFFSVFVMEGVIGLSGLISLVNHTGSDYVSSKSLLFW